MDSELDNVQWTIDSKDTQYDASYSFKRLMVCAHCAQLFFIAKNTEINKSKTR